tara:strand:+ start:1840 stop:2694 length:855 start_codon:yes stop_codon:yes gene_type:complete
MRKWFKYLILFGEERKKNIKKHDKFNEFEKAMGGYESNEHYDDKDKFNAKYLNGRFYHYNKYLKKNINSQMKILSVASGRCINELQFIDQDYDITCSDLDIPASYELAKKTFKEYKFEVLNILQSHTNEKYNCVLSLGLVYAFSANEFKIFFSNINKSLDDGGILILDSSSSQNNFITFFYDRIYLKIETLIISIILNLIGKKNSMGIRHHGYKFTNNEIISFAKANGFELLGVDKCDYLTEILRSKIASKLTKIIPFSKYFFIIFGFPMPYLRFFKFKKIKSL